MNESRDERAVLITGVAGFIGSHLADRLLGHGIPVVGLDNLTRGTESNIQRALHYSNFSFFQCDASDLSAIRDIVSRRDIDTVWHLIANSDIASGVADPSIDLRDTFLSTFNILIAMREVGIKRLAFASSSAVYGVHSDVLTESTGPLFPISNYGAMKLASEGLISAAVEAFLERAWIFRFPNVVGPRATHGIIFDLLKKLRANPHQLEVLGDGTQQKPYLHVSELLDAMILITDRASAALNCFNIGPTDPGTSVSRIAQAVVRQAAPSVPIRYTGGPRGWVGDVPRFAYSVEKLIRLGWSPKFSSEQAIERAVAEIHQEMHV